MKHLKLTLALVAVALAVLHAFCVSGATTEKKGEGVLEQAAEKVKHAMGFGKEETAYEEGREAVKGPTTKIGEMKQRLEETLQEGKHRAEGSHEEAKERMGAVVDEAAAQGQGMFETIKDKVGDALHMGKQKGEELGDAASRQARKTAEQAELTAEEAAARGHGVFETIKDKVTAPFHAAKETGEHVAHDARVKGQEAADYAAELKDQAAAKGRASYDAAKGRAEELGGAASHKVGQAKESLEEAYEGAAGKMHEAVEAAKRYAALAQEKAAEAAAYARGVRDEAVAESKHGVHHDEGLLDSAKRRVKEAFGKQPEPKSTMENMKEKVQETMEQVKEKVKEL